MIRVAPTEDQRSVPDSTNVNEAQNAYLLSFAFFFFWSSVLLRVGPLMCGFPFPGRIPLPIYCTENCGVRYR